MIILEALVFPVAISCPTGQGQYVKTVLFGSGTQAFW